MTSPVQQSKPIKYNNIMTVGLSKNKCLQFKFSDNSVFYKMTMIQRHQSSLHRMAIKNATDFLIENE